MSSNPPLSPEVVRFAHDLRNQLASVRAGASILQRSGDDSSVVAQVAGELQNHVREMVELVDGFFGKAAPASATVPAPAPADLTLLTVLIADDNADSADALARYLRLQDHRVHVAFDGEQALALAESEQPQVILLDISMPVRDGYTVAQEIRSRSWGRAARLIAMSGWLSAEDEQRALQAGFDTHLSKPIDLDLLEWLLRG